MKCPSLSELPPPPADKQGWPWTEGTPSLPDLMQDGSPWLRISIVTPSYNQGPYLEETIRSVLLQGYPNPEYIIIDGGSTDQSLEIIRKYAPWLACWVSEPDCGQSHAINKGFKRCTGDIITFLSSDDIYLPGAFTELAARWPEWKDCGALSGAFYFFENLPVRAEDLRLPVLRKPAPLDLTLGPPDVYRIHQVSTFYSTWALDAVGRYVDESLKYTMDRELLYRICRHSPLKLIDRPLAAFRRHAQSKSVSTIIPFWDEFAQLNLMHLGGNLNEDQQRRKMANHYRAHGQIKFALATSSILQAAAALLRALKYRPGLLVQSGYYSYWLRAIRLKPTS